MDQIVDLIRSLAALISENAVGANVVWTALLVAFLLLGYHLATQALRKRMWVTPEVRKRWLVMVRNASILILLFGVVIIWAEELQTLALSLVAISLAFVIAIKELILCVSGEILRSSTRLFTVGNRIEVNGVRGDVIDLNLLTTTVMEVGPGHQYTGRAALLPNSLFLSHPVYNESFTREFLLHTFTVAVRPEAWAEAERTMMVAAQDVCEVYLDRARRHIEKLGEQEGLDTPSAEPNVVLGMAEPDRVRLIVRVPVPVRQTSRVEQDIIRRFFKLFEETGHLRAPHLP